MNYFIYNAAEGCLWLEMKNPFTIRALFGSREVYDKALYNYNSRPHYECNDELKSMLKDGQRVGDNDFDLKWKVHTSSYQGDADHYFDTYREASYKYLEWSKYNGQLQCKTDEPVLLAIPKPEQKPNIAVIGAGEPSLKEERMFSLKEMIDCWDASEDFSNECFCGSCDYCTEVPIDVRAKDKHKYFKNKFNISI